MKQKLFGLAAAAAVSLTLLTGCPAEDKKESTTSSTTTTTTTTTTTSADPGASHDAHGTMAASHDAGGTMSAASPKTTTTTTTTTASAAPKTTQSAASSAPAATTVAASASDGKAVFTKNNGAACHGAMGEGGVGPNLTKVEAKGDAHIRNTILNGKSPMPPYKGQITDKDLDALVAYVKSL